MRSGSTTCRARPTACPSRAWRRRKQRSRTRVRSASREGARRLYSAARGDFPMRTNTCRRLLALAISLALALVAVAGAPQSTRPKIPPPDFKRECDTDAAGLKQWKAFDVGCPQCKGTKFSVCEHCKDTKFPICLECDGKKRAPCRTCGGRGKLPDPLVELACPYCSGSSWYPCGLCNGFGFLKIDDAETKCGACKQK